MAQWWERSPPTNESRIRFPDPASYVGWICCWFSTLLREVFLRALRFSSPQKPRFPNSNSILECTNIPERLLVPPWWSVGKQVTHFIFYILHKLITYIYTLCDTCKKMIRQMSAYPSLPTPQKSRRATRDFALGRHRTLTQPSTAQASNCNSPVSNSPWPLNKNTDSAFVQG